MNKRVFQKISIITKNIYIQFIRRQVAINISLFIIFLIIISFIVIRNNLRTLNSELFPFLYTNIDQISKIIGFFRNVFTILGIIIAGILSYYLFIKGRTFSPKLNVDINLRYLYGEKNEIAIIRGTFKNSGRIKIKPNFIEVESFYGIVKDNEIKFKSFYKCNDIFHEFIQLKKGEKYYLEPLDEMPIDFPVFLNQIPKLDVIEEQSNNLLLIKIKIIFVDNKFLPFLFNTILLINRKGENKSKCLK